MCACIPKSFAVNILLVFDLEFFPLESKHEHIITKKECHSFVHCHRGIHARFPSARQKYVIKAAVSLCTAMLNLFKTASCIMRFPII